mmetsp:Transcript_11859/g.15513  ORF Transcript_11859/g.15513 Transcript_11859/m.15513 type:complete len:221 (+) Transcript_11859:31-693(+)
MDRPRIEDENYCSHLDNLDQICCGTEIAEELSRQERENRGLSSTTLAYGELSSKCVASIIRDIRDEYDGLPREGGVMYDLGSGSGKALFAAHCAHQFDKCIGVEILESLHEKAIDSLSSLKEHSIFADRFSKGVVELRLGDLVSTDWSDANVVLIHATVFDNDLMARIQLKAEQMLAGTFFIVVSKELRTGVVTGIQTIQQYRFKASWGEATISLQMKSF